MSNDYFNTMTQAMAGLLMRPVVGFNPDFARISGSVNAGMMLSRMCELSDAHGDPCGDGWFCKTSEEWQMETAMTRREQETARRKLREAGLVEEDRRGLPAKVYFKINTNKLNDLLSKLG